MTAARRALREAAGMTDRSRSLQRMVRPFRSFGKRPIDRESLGHLAVGVEVRTTSAWLSRAFARLLILDGVFHAKEWARPVSLHEDLPVVEINVVEQHFAIRGVAAARN